MAIEEPKINVALTTNNGRTSILVRRTDADEAKPDDPMRWTCWQLATIERAGYMAACERIGNAVMRMLHQSHANLFAPHPMLVPPDELRALDQLTDLIHTLISRSADEKTSAYVPALDAIFARHGDELAQTELPEQWPTFRSVFLRHGSST
jgi:hypothetical protein